MKILLFHTIVTFELVKIVLSIVISNSDSVINAHECSRTCLTVERSKICKYHFYVSKSLTTRRISGDSTISAQRVINGTSPGPTIEICLGDKIEVIVENGLSTEELSFHWHGLRQLEKPHMDGVTMITQCPIAPYTSFRYSLKPESIGTYLYHSHSVRQQGDGLYGTLIVRGDRDVPENERILVVSARLSGTLSGILNNDDRTIVPRALILNGQTTKNAEIRISRGQKYLIRLINANVYNCPILFFVAKHNLDIIANDGHLVDRDSSAERIIIFPGERFDLSIHANKKIGRYSIGLQGFEDCRGLRHEAYLDYYHDNERNDDMMVYRDDEFYMNHDDEEKASVKYYCNVEFRGMRTICSLNLKGYLDNNDLDNNNNNNNKLEEGSSIETIYVPFDVNLYEDINDQMTDFSFNIYEFSYYPSFLSSGTWSSARIAQVNRMTFEYPSSPILSQPEAMPDDILCSIEKRAKLCNNEEKTFCECTQILRLPAHRTFDIVLIDEGFGGNTSHTFHVHGYDVGVVGIGQFDRPMRKNEIIELNDKGLLLRRNNEETALLRKDTFVVPNKGYLILRIHTDNFGYWLWEARSTSFYGGNNGQPPMQFVMLVGNQENLPIVPINFPICGNHKSPASIFHDTD